MIKKLLVAVLAMAMVIGTMAVSAFAADDVVVRVAASVLHDVACVAEHGVVHVR